MDKFVIKRKATEQNIDIIPQVKSLSEATTNAINAFIVSNTNKRGKYANLTVSQKLEVGRHAIKHGNTNALKMFGDKYDLKLTSIRN